MEAEGSDMEEFEDALDHLDDLNPTEACKEQEQSSNIVAEAPQADGFIITGEGNVKLKQSTENTLSSHDSTMTSAQTPRMPDCGYTSNRGNDCCMTSHDSEKTTSHSESGGDNPESYVAEAACTNLKDSSELLQGLATESKDITSSSNDDLADELNEEDETSDTENAEEPKDDTDARKQKEDAMSEEEREALKEEAQVLKKKGNELFREKSYEEALVHYTDALHSCPLCYVKERAILYSNRAACKMHLERYEGAIEDSNKALELNPHYLKALLRRAEMQEKTEKLDEALTDYQRVLEMDPSQHSARQACMRLPDKIKERNEKLKEEMIGKLKDLGNMVLKPFGLSTDNFQLQQDPNTGSYSVNFKQNK